MALFQKRNYLAHVFLRRSARLFDGRLDRCRNLARAQPFGQIAFDDRDLGLLDGHQIRPVAGFEMLDGFAPLLDHLGQRLDEFNITRLRLAEPLGRKVDILEFGADQPQRRQPRFVAGFHGGLHGFGNNLAHGGSL